MVSSMDSGRSYLASTLAKNDSHYSKSGGKYVYVVAGCLTENTSTAEVFSIKSGLWHNLPNTLTKRDSLGLLSCDGEIYAIGGFNNIAKQYLKSAERFDPLENQWIQMKPMHVSSTKTSF